MEQEEETGNNTSELKGLKFGRITRIDRVGERSPTISVCVSDPKTSKSLGWEEAVRHWDRSMCSRSGVVAETGRKTERLAVRQSSYGRVQRDARDLPRDPQGISEERALQESGEGEHHFPRDK